MFERGLWRGLFIAAALCLVGCFEPGTLMIGDDDRTDAAQKEDHDAQLDAISSEGDGFFVPGRRDAHAVDSGVSTDTGGPVPFDSGVPDRDVSIAMPDAITEPGPDTVSTQDTSVADTSVADTSVADTSVADTSVADTSAPDTSVADTGADVEHDVAPDADEGPICGNNVIETGEYCDPPSSCPTSCPNNGCQIGTLSGSANECTARCTYTTKTTCQHGDGCCPPGCNANNDNDCAPTCGNSVIESGEYCDPPSSCPTSCPSNGCQIGTLSGSANECTARCTYTTKTTCENGDGCCPSGCDASNDNDCALDCRDPATWPGTWKAMETEVVRLMNEHRARGASCGVHGTYAPTTALTMHTNVEQAARCHSVDQWEHSTMTHTGSDGSTIGQRLTREGYTGWTAAAENVARGQTSAASVVNSWMNSDGHCRNIMNPIYRDVGIGYVHRYWTAKFGRR